MNDGQDYDENAIGSAADEMSEPSEAETLALLEKLRHEHRRIDQEIDALLETGVADMLKVRRMKKIKLSMKNQIAYLENQVTPDIIA
ncbi:MAG: DUF465 domain-containing protein [Pseudomonadota bacterium]